MDPGIGARHGIGRVGVVDPGVGAARAAEAVSFRDWTRQSSWILASVRAMGSGESESWILKDEFGVTDPGVLVS